MSLSHRVTEMMEKLSKVDNFHGDQALFVDISMIEYRKVFRYNANQVNTVVLIPPVGWKLCVRNISSISSGNVGAIKMDFVDSNQAVYDHYVNNTTRTESIGGHIVGNVDEGLTINTTTGANDVSISIVYTYHQ